MFSWSSRSLYSNRLVSYDQTNVDIKTGLRCARRFSHSQNFIPFYPYMKFLSIKIGFTIPFRGSLKFKFLCVWRLSILVRFLLNIGTKWAFFPTLYDS